MTHEEFIELIRQTVISRLNEDSRKEKLLSAKLAYGSGSPGVRGSCFFGSWENSAPLEFIEICAYGEESVIQLAGTIIHELAHCLAGPAAGHNRQWKAAAKLLGLVRAQAMAQNYAGEDFDPTLWPLIQVMPEPTDGRPRFSRAIDGTPRSRGCPLGNGTKGGKSRGPGAGSRLRLFTCSCNPPIRIRVARDENDFRVRCLLCGERFRRSAPGPSPKSQSFHELLVTYRSDIAAAKGSEPYGDFDVSRAE